MGLGKLLSSLFGRSKDRADTPPSTTAPASRRPRSSAPPANSAVRATPATPARPAPERSRIARPVGQKQTSNSGASAVRPTPAKPATPQSENPTSAKSPQRRRDLPTLYGSRETTSKGPSLHPLPKWLTIEGSALDPAETRSLANEIMRRRPKELLPGDMELDHFEFGGGRVEVRWIHYDMRGITAAATYRGRA